MATFNDLPDKIGHAGSKRRTDMRCFKKFNHTEKKRLYQLYQYEFSLGKTTTEIANDLGLSASTLYRWQRDEGVKKRRTGAPSKPVSEMIKALSGADSHLSYEILYNMCLFNAWLRWPNFDQDHYDAANAGIFRYILLKFQKDKIGELNSEFMHGLIQTISIEKLAEMYSPTFNGHADFSEVKLWGQNYTEREVVANLGWYLISCDGKPSFDGAYTTLRDGVNGRQYRVSRASFQKFWHDNLLSSPFMYVQIYHSDLTWSFDPFASDFVETIDDLIAQPDARRIFFANSRHAISEIVARIDKRSLGGELRGLTFPDDLPKPTIRFTRMPRNSAKTAP